MLQRFDTVLVQGESLFVPQASRKTSQFITGKQGLKSRMNVMASKNSDQDSATSKKERIRVGTALIRQLSTSFYPKAQMIFDELVTNARDAMSTEVHVSIYEDFIEISDNGEGMTPDELVRFFYISSTHKSHLTERFVRGVKREIIGKFGIGKLSIYQIANKFRIETWKDGMMAFADFDFSEFEKKDYIDNFFLDVKSKKTSKNGSGTIIKLTELRHAEKRIRASDIRRSLQRNMPLTSDFKIIVQGIGLDKPVTLRSVDIISGVKHEINENVKGLGDVTGFIVYKNTEKGDYGIYVRIFGRLIDPTTQDVKGKGEREHGGSFYVNLSSLSHARQFMRKIYAEFNVDALDEALQTNRAGFVESNSKYIIFCEWVKDILNKYNNVEYKRWKGVRHEIETEDMPREISRQLKDVIVQPDIFVSPKKVSTSRKTFVEHRKENKKVPTFNFNKIISKAAGEELPEAILDDKKNLVVINTSHPIYGVASSRGGLWGAKYHMVKSAIIAIALERSSDLDEFKTIYEDMIRKTTAVLDERVKHQRWRGNLGKKL